MYYTYPVSTRVHQPDKASGRASLGLVRRLVKRLVGHNLCGVNFAALGLPFGGGSFLGRHRAQGRRKFGHVLIG